MGTAIRTSRQQAREHNHYWSERPGGELTYVALGDSAGVGVGVENPQHSYVGLLAARLTAHVGRPVGMINLSVSGATARRLLVDQIPRLEALPAPDVVTCVVGGNDVAWATRYRDSEFARTMEQVAARLPRGSIIGLVPSFGHWPYEGRVRRANDVILNAAQRHGHTVADLHTPTVQPRLLHYLPYVAGDFFHPNETGHAVWADAIWPAMLREASSA